MEKKVTAKVESKAEEAKAQLGEIKKDLGAAADSATQEAGANLDAARDTVDLVSPIRTEISFVVGTVLWRSTQLGQREMRGEGQRGILQQAGMQPQLVGRY